MNIKGLACSDPNKRKNDPNGIRTRVIGVRGRRPRPLDDGTKKLRTKKIDLYY